MKIKKFENFDFSEDWEEEPDYEDFKFRRGREPKKDELYLMLDFEGGDADTKHPEYYKFDFPFSEYRDNLAEIYKVIKKYKTLGRILDVNNRDFCDNYRDVLKKFGQDIARLFDNTPNDPQTDYDTKCYLGGMRLVGYDKDGVEHESYIF
jgi:hypothetical protein